MTPSDRLAALRRLVSATEHVARVAAMPEGLFPVDRQQYLLGSSGWRLVEVLDDVRRIVPTDGGKDPGAGDLRLTLEMLGEVVDGFFDRWTEQEVRHDYLTDRYRDRAWAGEEASPPPLADYTLEMTVKERGQLAVLSGQLAWLVASLEEVGGQAESPAATNGTPALPETPTNARGHYVYEQWQAGALEKVIRQVVNSTPGWPRLSNAGHTRLALQRYAEKADLPMPSPRRRGRKRSDPPKNGDV